MIKALADFFRKPMVYKPILWFLILVALYMHVIGPLMGIMDQNQPTMLDVWIMRGR